MATLKKVFISFIFIFLPFVCLADNVKMINFDSASSQYLSISDASQTGLDMSGTDYTIEFWIRPDASSESGFVIAKRENGAGKAGYQLYMDTGKMNPYYYDGTDAATFTSAIPFIANTWYHYAIVRNSTTLQSYINGVATTSVSASLVGNLSNAVPFHMGARSLPVDNYIDADVDQVRFWSSARTAGQIAAHYNCEITDYSTTSLVSLWNFDDDDLLDETSSNNDLTNNNGSSFASGGIVALSPCYVAEEEPAATSTQDFSETDLYTSRDLTTIEATTYIYTDSTSTPSELRRTIYHIPQFVVFLFLILFLQIFELFRIEFLIRWRKKPKI